MDIDFKTKPVKRIPRGRKTLSEILSAVDSSEIRKLNKQLGNHEPVGKERIPPIHDLTRSNL